MEKELILEQPNNELNVEDITSDYVLFNVVFTLIVTGIV